MAKILALLSLLWLASVCSKKVTKERTKNLNIKLKPDDTSPVKIIGSDDAPNEPNEKSGERMRVGAGGVIVGGGGGAGVCATAGSCSKVIWGTRRVSASPHVCLNRCRMWWLNGAKDRRKTMIVKVRVKTRHGKILVFYFRVRSDKTSLSFCQAVKKRKNGKNIYACKTGWQVVQIVNIDSYIGGSIIQFVRDNKQMWGLVNGIGQITVFGYPHQLIYFINRMFINYLIKSQLIIRGYTVISYKLYWLGKWGEFKIPPSPDAWLIPTWILKAQRRILYRVVWYCQVVHVQYIGPPIDAGIMTITIWIQGKVVIFKVRIDTVYIHWCRVKGKKKKCNWKKIPLVKIWRRIGLSIVRWQTISGQWMTGLANANGDIIAFAAGSVMEFYRLTVNRLFLQYLMIHHVVRPGRYTITRYRITWQGKTIVDIKITEEVTIDVTALLIPNWLPDDQCRVVWKVVKYESTAVVIYIGGEVSGPILTECIRDRDSKDCKLVDSTELDIDVPSINFPEIIPVPPKCKRFNENGRCVDLINPDGYCYCSKLCTCMDPFDYFKRKYLNFAHFDPIFPGSLIPGGIRPGTCVTGVGYGCGPALHPPQLPGADLKPPTLVGILPAPGSPNVILG